MTVRDGDGVARGDDYLASFEQLSDAWARLIVREVMGGAKALQRKDFRREREGNWPDSVATEGDS